jgi:hypothetical protein
MDVIQEITIKTSEGSTRASGSIGELTVMVKDMQNSVAGFKLPGIVGAEETMIQPPGELAGFMPGEEARQ